jgi:hypothetical protein
VHAPAGALQYTPATVRIGNEAEVSERTSEDLRDAEHDGGARLASHEAFPTRLPDALPYPVSYIDADLVTQASASCAL